MLNRDYFFKSKQNLVKVDIEDGDLWVRPLTLKEDEESGKYRRDSSEWQVYIVRVSCCDEEGNPYFIENDHEALCNAPASLFSPIIEAIMIANKWIDGGTEDKGN